MRLLVLLCLLQAALARLGGERPGLDKVALTTEAARMDPSAT
jgi:hypothetical protein